MDFEVEGDQGEITLDFTAFDATTLPEEGEIYYDTEDCSVHVALGLLAGIIGSEAEAGYDIDVNAALMDNYEFDFDKAEMGKSDSGMRFEDGELIIASDGFVELTEGERLLRVRATGLTALKQALLETEGVSIEVISGNVPLGSEASYIAHTDEETAELVENYINNEENGDVAVAGYSAADLKIVRNDETLPVEGQFKVTVDKASLVPEGMKLDKLYHIHGEEVEELKVEETEEGLVFEVENFSDIVASYTVDFEYIDAEGNVHTWKFPGTGSYKLIDVFAGLGVEVENISYANLELVEVVGEEPVSEKALYLDKDADDDITINSDEAFNDVYELTVIADDIPYLITVTDEQMWTVNLNLYDYDGTSQATEEELSVLSGKSYGVVAVLRDKTTHEIAGYNKTKIGVSFGSSNTASCEIGMESFKTLEWSGSWWNEGNTIPSADLGNYDMEFRLYEGDFSANQWQHMGYSNIIGQPDSMTGYEFLAQPNGNIVDTAKHTTTFNLKRAYDKQYNVRLQIEPAGLTIKSEDEFYAFVMVDHQTTGTSYGFTKITAEKGDTVIDFPITQWYDSNGALLNNEKFTGNETVTLRIYTTNKNGDGNKTSFNDINSIKNSQVKVLVAEGTSLNKYNIYYDKGIVPVAIDSEHLTKLCDTIVLRAPNGNISKADIDRYLEDATDFGYYTVHYIGHASDIEATIGAAELSAKFSENLGYSTANENVNRLKVLKIYTNQDGTPVANEPVVIRLTGDDGTQKELSGNTNENGILELEFEGLKSQGYAISEKIKDTWISDNGSAQIGETTYSANFSSLIARFVANGNMNYFGKILYEDDNDLYNMLDKASRVDVVVLTDSEDGVTRVNNEVENTQLKNKGVSIVGIQNGTGGYKHYDIENDMLYLKELSTDLVSAQNSQTIRVLTYKASEISENGLKFDDDGRYIVLNILMDKDTFCPTVYIDGQELKSDYGQSGNANSSRVLFNLRDENGGPYTDLFNTSKSGAGVILAPWANAHELGGPFGGTIITDRVDRKGNELHSNNPNQIQTLNVTIQNVIGTPTTGSLELRKEFANTDIKDRITYFTFKVALKNDDQSLVQNATFPASGLKKGLGNMVTFDENGEAEVLVRAGNSVTIANLPQGTTYTVTEILTPETEHFTLDRIEGKTGKIEAGKTSSAKVYNNIKKADLTIEKEVSGTTDESREFEFTLLLQNNTAGTDETENWQDYPDAYKISIAGQDEITVAAGTPSYTFRLKAGQKAEINDLDVSKVIRYTITESAIYINDERHAITEQPFYGYSNSELVKVSPYTRSGERVVFNNKYGAMAQAQIVTHKQMLGRELAASEFNFELRENSPTGAVIATATNAADGTVTFGNITYKIDHSDEANTVDCMVGAATREDGSRIKTFTYYICEVVPEPADANIAYAEPIEVKVKVVDDGVGNLIVCDEEEKALTVSEGVYTYALPEAKNIVNTLKTQQTLEGTKTLIGRDMAEGEKFYFNVTETVHNAETNEDETVVVATGEATGGEDNTPVNIAFTPIEYVYSGTPADYPQTHTYTITEDTTRLGVGVTHDPVQSYTATVTVTYDASAGTFTASEPVYSEGVAFINNWEERYINFTVTKEWKVEDTAVYAPRTITFSVKKNGVDFDLTSVNIEQTNSGVGSFSVSGNTVTLTAGENGWPVVKFVNVPEATYVVEETATTGKLEDTTLTTGYALNGEDKASNAAAAATADGDAIVIKNSEEIPEENRAELTLKKIWDPTQFTDDADKQTVTYELYQVAASGESSIPAASNAGSNTFEVRLSSYDGLISSGRISYDNIGDTVSITISSNRMEFSVSNNNSFQPSITESTTNGTVTATLTVLDWMPNYGVDLYTYTASATDFGQTTVSGGSGVATPLIVEQLTATPTDHATIAALGGTKYGEYTLNKDQWETGITVTVPKSTGSTNWQYYVVEKDGDAYEATYTQDTGNTLVVTNHKKAQGALKIRKVVQASESDPVNGDITKANGTYTFTVKGPASLPAEEQITRTVVITMNSGAMTAASIDGVNVTADATQFDAATGVTLSGLALGDYEVKETGWTLDSPMVSGSMQVADMALVGVQVGGVDATVENHAVDVTVNSGDTASVDVVFTNKLVPTNVTVDKQITDINDTEGEEGSDSTSEYVYNYTADYDVGDRIPYRVKGNLPQEYFNAQDAYYFQMVDRMQNLTLQRSPEDVHMYAFVKSGQQGYYYQVDEYFDFDWNSGSKVLTATAKYDPENGKMGLRSVVCGYKVTDWGGSDTHNANKFQSNPITTATTATPIDTDDIEYLEMRYWATLDNTAIIGGSGNPNFAKIIYSNSATTHGETGEVKCVVFTYKLQLNKTDGTNALAGADFELYKKFLTYPNASEMAGGYKAIPSGWKKCSYVDGKNQAITVIGPADKLPAQAQDIAESAFTNAYVWVPKTSGSTAGSSFVWNEIDDGNYLLVETQTPANHTGLPGPIMFGIFAEHGKSGDNRSLDSFRVDQIYMNGFVPTEFFTNKSDTSLSSGIIVTVPNYITKDITVVKAVPEGDTESQAEAASKDFSFTVTLKKADGETPFTGFVKVQDKTRTTPTVVKVTDGTVGLTVHGLAQAQILEVPEGTKYQIQEINIPAGWELDSVSPAQDALAELDNDATITFTNKIKRGSLDVVKQISGGATAEDAADKVFPFTVVLTPAAGKAINVDSLTLSGTGVSDFVKPAENPGVGEQVTVTFNITGANTATLNGIPDGATYVVTEGPTEGWLQDGVAVYDDTDMLIGNATADAVTVTNKPEPRTLIIRKAVDPEGKGGDTEFTFNVRLYHNSNNIPNTAEITYVVKSTTAEGTILEGTPVTLTINNLKNNKDSFPVILKEGEWVEITGIPFGIQYEVTESAPAGWKWDSYTLNGKTTTFGSRDPKIKGTFDVLDVQQLDYTATNTGSRYIYVKKALKPAATEDKTFTVGLFDVDPAGDATATPIKTAQLMVKEGQTESNKATFDKLLPGTYWVYELDDDNQAITDGTATIGGKQYNVETEVLINEWGETHEAVVTANGLNPQVTVTNALDEPWDGDLTVRKVVVGGTEENANDTFVFRIHLTPPEGESLKTSYWGCDADHWYEFPVENGIITTNRVLVDGEITEDDNYVPELKSGVSLTIGYEDENDNGLFPAGTEYWVEEIGVDGEYVPVITGGTNGDGTGIIDGRPNEVRLVTVTNIKTTSIDVIKQWKAMDNGQAVDIPWPENVEVTVGLYRSINGGTPEAVPGADGTTPQTAVLKADNPSHTFTDLPKCDSTGAAYTYSVKEIAVSLTDSNGSVISTVDTSAHTGGNTFSLGLMTFTVDESAVSDNTDTAEGAAPLAATVTNTLGNISLNVVKLAKGTTTKLSGAKFQLTRKLPGEENYTRFANDGFEDYVDADGTRYEKKGPFTVTSGEITVSGLLPGDYKLQEKRSPDGYIIMTRDIEFTVNPDGTVKVTGRNEDSNGKITYSDENNLVTFMQKKADANAEVAVENEPGAVLPSTGGMGTGVVYGAGAALVLLAVLGMILTKRKRTDGEGIR